MTIARRRSGAPGSHGARSSAVGWLTTFVAAAFLALAALVAPQAAPGVRAADADVDVEARTTYSLSITNRRVHVRIDATLTNVREDTATERFFYTGYVLGIHEDATRIRASHDGDPLDADVSREDGYQTVAVDFGRRVFRNESFDFRLEYELPNRDEAEADTRVSSAFAAFYSYAFGEDEAEVRIVLPEGFEPTLREGAQLEETRGPRGTTVLVAESIEEPGGWWAYVGAERPETLRRYDFSVNIAGEREQIRVSAWPEDDEWAGLVRRRLSKGLPVMGRLVGLPWPIEERLEVSEVFSPLLGGYAGVYFERDDEIRIAEEADEHVVLHEASHAWFNRTLFTERWINEGLADEYAARTLARLERSGQDPEPVARDDAASFPLQEWSSPARVPQRDIEARERYGYNAAWLVMRALVEEVGEERMREVLRAAATDEIAYVGAGEPERVSSLIRVAGWRVFLDLLQERGASEDADGLFRTWVLPRSARDQLRARRETREAYRALVAAGDGWLPPYAIRVQLAQWRFRPARQLISAAHEVLRERERVEQLAGGLGLEAPGSLRRAYEDAERDFGSARGIASDQLRTLESLTRVRQELDRERDLFTTVGLLLEQGPEQGFAQARDAFEADDQSAARAAAERTMNELQRAPASGRERLALIVAGVVGALGVVVALALLLRRRRRRLGEAAAAPATLPAPNQEDPPRL